VKQLLLASGQSWRGFARARIPVAPAQEAGIRAGDCEEVQRRLVPAGNAFEQLARDEDWTLVTEHFAWPVLSEPASSNLM